MHNGWIFLASLVVITSAVAQEASPAPYDVERNLLSLKVVAEPLATSLEELKRLQQEQKLAKSEERKQELAGQIEAERERIAQFRGHFRDIVGGAESAAFEQQEEKEVPLREQFSALLAPIVAALREPTEQLRDTENLRKLLAEWSAREEKAARVVSRIAGLQQAATAPRVLGELETARRVWSSRLAEASGQAEILKLRIEERELNTPTMWEAFSQMFSNFWKSRGLNLLLALVSGGLGFVAVRQGYAWLRTSRWFHRREKSTLTGRIADLLAVATSVLVAVVSVILIFYLRGDWLLLTVVAILLFATIWAGKTALPPYLEQIRMLLNMGTVREDERVIYHDLPWKVKSLGFFTIFSNPDLDGGELRIPLRDVMGMVSRVSDPKEPWFPTRKDDWVVLTDDTYGKIIRQSPEQVIVLKLGGSLKTYPTREFLARMPENLSHGFRIQTVFGIDYSHQAIATGEVVEILSRDLAARLTQHLGKEGLHSAKVEFHSAATSSLDYAVLTDFSGDLASRYRFLSRLVQRLCVEISNEQGWIIPFTQVTVHQAAVSGTEGLPGWGETAQPSALPAVQTELYSKS